MSTAYWNMNVLHQGTSIWQPWLSPDSDCARPNKELPTVRWRHERREKNGAGYAKHRVAIPPAEKQADAPLDMTTPRGLPPPYSQYVGSRGIKSSARPSVITCARKPPSAAGGRKEQLSDPVIDEHFRRSLGNDYMNLFAGSDEKATNGSSVTVTGLSVDDHFAKALGDTWVRLQKSDSDSSSTKGDDSPPPVSAPTTPTTPSPDKTTGATTTKPPAASSLLQPRRGLLSI